jgi:hypothetical protein
METVESESAYSEFRFYKPFTIDYNCAVLRVAAALK